MTDYSITRARMYQWVGILLILAVVGGAYWYFQVRAGVTLNTSGISGTAKLNASQNASITNGLVGLWSFNGQDISDTIAYDRSGSGKNGTLTNSPTKVIGKIGQALHFNGSNAFVDLGDISSVVGSNTEGSVSLWFTNENDSASPLFHYGKNSSDVILFRLMFSSANTLQVLLKNPAGGDFYRATVNLGASSANGSWHHIVFTVNASGNVLYYDGFPVTLTYSTGSSASTSWFDDITTEDIATIGRDRISSANNYHTGSIDEVRIYNRALSATEIQSLYDLGQSDKINSSVVQPQGTGRLDSGLAGYWKLDDASGISATDSSTNGNAGTLTNGPTWTTGQINGAVDFDGTDDYVTVPDADTLDVVDSTNFTLSGWFNRDTFTTDDTILAKSNGQTAADTGYNVYIDDATDKVTFVANDGTDQYKLESTATFTATGWNHYAIVWNDAASAQTKLYINGASQVATETGTFANVNSLANALAFRLGAESDAGNPFDGKLDEARIYSRTLSDDEISQLYRLTVPTAVDTSLKGYWSFNGQDMSGTTAFDRSGAGNTGTLTSGPTTVIGKIGQGLLFDGVDDYVKTTGVPLKFTSDFSFGGWVYTTKSSDENFLLAWDGGSADGYRLIIDNAGSNYLICTVKLSTTNATITVAITAGSVANKWTHLLCTYNDTAKTVTLYRDGVNIGTSEAGSGTVTYPTFGQQALLIGSSYDAVKYFGGSIDDVRIYNRALSATEVADLYNQGR